MSQQLPIIILLAPMLSAVLVVLLGLWKRKVCFPLALAALIGSFWAAMGTLGRVVAEGPVDYYLGGWHNPPGIGIQLRVDLISGLVLVMITVVALITVIYSMRRVEEETPDKISQFYALYLLLVTGLLGMTITADAFNLYVLLEVSALTSYALIAMGQSKRGTLAAFHYIIMGTIGASFYLLGVGYLYLKTGSLNMMDIRTVLAAEGLFESPSILVAFILIMVGVWIKMAFFPLYGWLPNAYSFAPSTTGCLVAPLMTKVSVYIMIRMILTVFGPEYTFGHLEWSRGVVWLAVAAILAGSVLALAQADLKKMLCYLIVAEVGYMVGGVWLANHYGMVGSIYHIISDAFMTLCLFLAASIFFRRTGVHHIKSLDGMFRKMPMTMACFTVGGLAMIGVPPTCGFFSKWYLIRGGMESGHWEYVVALLVSSLINAVLFFRIFEVAYFGAAPAEHGHGGSDSAVPAPGKEGGSGDAGPGPGEPSASLLVPLMTAAVSLLVLGIYNAPLVELIRASLSRFAIVGGSGL